MSVQGVATLVQFVQACQRFGISILRMKLLQRRRQRMQLLMQMNDDLENRVITVARLAFILQPTAKTALVMNQRQGLALTSEESFEGDDPGTVLDAGEE